MQRTDSLEKTLMLGKIESRREGDDRVWDGWMASPTQWTWVWTNSGSWWWIGRPGVLQSMGSQRVEHDRVTELNWTDAGKDWRWEEKGTTGWDDWMASPTQWTWVWVNSRSWWWTGSPGVLQSMGSQRAGHDWAIELNWKCWWQHGPYKVFVKNEWVDAWKTSTENRAGSVESD